MESNVFCQATNNESPKGLTRLRTGFVLQDIDLDIKWMNRVVEHVKKCPKTKLEVIQNTPRGGELITTYKCRSGDEDIRYKSESCPWNILQRHKRAKRA